MMLNLIEGQNIGFYGLKLKGPAFSAIKIKEDRRIRRAFNIIIWT